MDDTTFSAFIRDPRFLKTILPITDHLDHILRRIFHCDPDKRITLPELRTLIMQCPAFTLQYAASGLPLFTHPYYPQVDSFQTHPYYDTCDQVLVACPSETGSAYSDSCASMASSSSLSTADQSFEQFAAPESNNVTSPAVPQQPWYSNLMPDLDFAHKHMAFQPVLQGLRVF